MVRRIRWPKAWCLSLTFHALILGSFLCLEAFLFAAPPPLHEETPLEIIDMGAEQEETAATVPQTVAAPQETPPEIPPEPADQQEEQVVDTLVSELGKESIKEKALPVLAANAVGVAAPGKSKAMGTPPEVITRVYPDPKSGKGFKGQVVLRVQILETGLPGNIIVSRSSSRKEIDGAAIAAAKLWRFKPAKDHEGNPMVCTTILIISFDRSQQVPNKPET
ncbi:MAG: energy transducer TonB [Sporomusaceae bacterium]|nr:energy transducer TonB [Sporomusaceae bacterium]